MKNFTNSSRTSYSINTTIKFNEFNKVFKCGNEVYVYWNDEPLAGELVDSQYHDSPFGQYISFSIKCISVTQTGLVGMVTFRGSLPSWKGDRPLSALRLKMLTPEIKHKLTERGRIFKNVIFSPTYITCEGAAYIPQYPYWTKVPTDSRIIIDPIGGYISNPEFMSDFNRTFDEPDRDCVEMLSSIEDERLYMTVPYVPAFSFKTKQWIAAPVTQLVSIEYDADAYEKLVLDSTYKHLIKSLVKNDKNSFSDIIQGKSGGFIFLLHGSPGSGKTLTAEAVAELLHKPLYSISIGELGVTPESVEHNLISILQLGSRWNAVLLLDEADIFLEQRQDHDLVRNAMVAIFLRQLEYFDGVLFLTTNRVKNFDKAFNSRISLAIHYESPTSDIREKIWKILLESAHINLYSDTDISTLSKYELNGRQIKNCIRLATALNSPKFITINDLIKIIELSEQFEGSVLKSFELGRNYA